MPQGATVSDLPQRQAVLATVRPTMPTKLHPDQASDRTCSEPARFEASSGRVRRFRLTAVAPGLAIGAALLSAGQLPTLCPFRICTGHACPLCGMTRSAGAFVQGNFVEAFRFHPLTLLVGAQLVLLAVFQLVTGRRPRSSAIRPAVLATSAVVVAVWLARWQTGALEYVLSN